MKLFILFTFIISSINLSAQDNKGYYNSKFFISFDGLVNNPFFYNIKNSYNEFSYYDKNLVERKDKVNYGFKLDIAYIAKRNVALSVELGQEFSNIYTPSRINYNYFYPNSTYSESYSYDVKQSSLNVRTFSIVPKIHFATKNALLPLGLNHQIGVAINYSKIVDNDAPYEIIENTDYYSSTPTIVDSIVASQYKTKFFDYENQIPTRTIAFLYALNMRTPITKNLLLSYGFRYTFRVNLNSMLYTANFASNEFVYSQEDISNLIKVQRTRNIINFNLGLTYAF